MTRSMEKLKSFVAHLPDSEIWILSLTKIRGNVYRDRIKQSFPNAKIRVLPFRVGEITGEMPQNAIILLCDEWYLTKTAENASFKRYLKQAHAIPMEDCPPPQTVAD